MNICFYVHSFRDRDLWPIARTALVAGHDIYYGLAERTSISEIIAQDRKLPFDLVISADRMSLDSDVGYLHLSLRKKPPLLEVIFNGLHEITENHLGKSGDFSHLEEQKITLGIMDAELLQVCLAVGLRQAVLFRYGVPPFGFSQPDFFIRRFGRRAFGALTPKDLQPGAGSDRLLNRIVHKLSGNTTGRRLMDIVFLGECNLASKPALIESIRSRYFQDQPADFLVGLDEHVRAEFDASPPRTHDDIADLVSHRLESVREGVPARLGKALLTEHFVHQFRTARRLHYVRELQAAFGRRLWLYGDDFGRLGLDALPSSHGATETKYLRAKIAVDFGSNSYSSSMYTRSVRIIYCSALLLQLRQSDARYIYGRLAPDMTFVSPEEMIGQLSNFLAGSQQRESVSAALQTLHGSEAGMEHALATVLATFNRGH